MEPDFLLKRMSDCPLPPAPPGETAREALDRRIEWTRVLYTERKIPNRMRVLAAWDDLPQHQKDELKGQNIFNRSSLKAEPPEYWDELPGDGPIKWPIRKITVPGAGSYRGLPQIKLIW